MAILKDLGLEVQIVVGGTTAPEYPDPEHDPRENEDHSEENTHHCYIESREGEEFYIFLRLSRGTQGRGAQWIDEEEKTRAMAVIVSIDGSRVATKTSMNAQFKETKVLGMANADNMRINHFRFASVSTVDSTDKGRLAKDVETAKHLGLIQVRLRRCVYTGGKKPSSSHTSFSAQPEEITVAEKALKGRSVSHSTTVSSNFSIDTSTTVDVEYLDSRHAPYAIFYFKYRSKDDLKNEMIIPRSREPSIESVDAMEEMPAEEVQRLARQRLQAQMENLENFSSEELRRLARQELRQVKGEHGRPVSVKRERGDVPRSEQPVKYVRLDNGKDAIDLTED